MQYFVNMIHMRWIPHTQIEMELQLLLIFQKSTKKNKKIKLETKCILTFCS